MILAGFGKSEQSNKICLPNDDSDDEIYRAFIFGKKDNLVYSDAGR